MPISFTIKKVYTENPYVDELIYYTKLLAIGTVLKNESTALKTETVESLRYADIYIACKEGKATDDLFDSYSETAIMNAGIIIPSMVKECMIHKSSIPEKYRATVLANQIQEFIDNYEDQNDYYRMLNGLPNIGQDPIYVDWEPPENYEIDLTKPLHEMNSEEIKLLEDHGVIDDLYDEDPNNRQYLRHLGDKKIDVYTARKAINFSAIYVPTIDNEEITRVYKDKLDSNRMYVMKTVYSGAYAYDSDYYDNFISVFIVLITMVDVISRVQEFIARKEIFDIRSIEYIFDSYGVPFFARIPIRFQIKLVKNLHTLLKYKSTATCMINICKLFGFDNAQVFKYYLLKDHTHDSSTNDFKFAYDEEGNEDVNETYELKFLKMPLTGKVDEYIRDVNNYVDYDEITEEEYFWDGGLDHEAVKEEILKQQFNYIRTKYISIDTMYDISKISIQQAYFFGILYDDVKLEELLTIKIPFIAGNREFRVSDVFTLLTALTFSYNGAKDVVMDTPTKVMTINGFNFKADLGELAAHLKQFGYTLHAKEALDKFKLEEGEVLSFNQLMSLFDNNIDVRSMLVEGMAEADNLRVYLIYEKLYKSLMEYESVQEFYKNPDTGDFYRDEEGDATLSAFLEARDPYLYDAFLKIKTYEDTESTVNYIANLIDNIVYALEEYIDSEEYSGIFHSLPVVSTEAIKEYISWVIDFFKSYKVHFLGLNTIYTFDDKYEGAIRIIDDIFLFRYWEKNTFITWYDKIQYNVDTVKVDFIHPIDEISMNIDTWSYKDTLDSIIPFDQFGDLISHLTQYDKIDTIESLKIAAAKVYYDEFIYLADYLYEVNTQRLVEDGDWISDDIEIILDYDETMDKMDLVEEGHEGEVLTLDEDGNPVASSYTIGTDTLTGDENTLATEAGVTNYMGETYISKESLKTTDTIDTENPSGDTAMSEQGVVESLSWKDQA